MGERPKNMIWTYDNQKASSRPSRVEETGHQANFYSVQAEDGTWVDDLDRALQKIENVAEIPYEMLLAGEIPSGQRKADFAHFVGSLYSRSPAAINASARGYAQFLEHLLDMQCTDRASFDVFMDRFEKDSGNSDTDRDELFAFMKDKERYWIEVSQKRGLNIVAIADELAQLFYDRNWYLVDAFEDFYISSDSPVFRWVSEEYSDPLRGDGGFANPMAEVSVPLSPRRMLLITGQHIAQEHIVVPAEHVWELNKARAIEAERFLYSHVRDDRVMKLAVEHNATRERFVIEGAGPSSEVKVTR
jgi:hypothetical protein